jgi:hypothetical protein
MLAMWTEREVTPAVATQTGPTPLATLSGKRLTARTYRVNTLTGTIGYTPVLPYRPIWFGLMFNILFFALIAASVYWLLNRPRRLVMELLRMRRGCCIACGYELDFDFKSGCPECGWRREHAEHSHAR